MYNVRWYESPDRLDRLRAESDIFVSTSSHEPFGLSILEAMAAGLCVIIPADGAYWDQQLKDGIDCVKYRPGDALDLAEKIMVTREDPNRVERIGDSARRLASNYCAEWLYAPIAEQMLLPQTAGAVE
jgi:glycosyltransferase involved in cell wall biosynthesis